MISNLSRLILEWYGRHARRLPWRGVKDAYCIWVSEVMLQQTRVETVIPYYQRWLQRFPDLNTLAAADEQDVLAAWEGLGYYSRARNLWQAARELVGTGHDRLPRQPRELEKLPGVGKYTAGAIASIAYGLAAPALDGNIKRVLARVSDLGISIDEPAGIKYLWSLAAELLPPGRAGDHNQALMDLGALVCLPRNPLCMDCPLTSICLARLNGTQALRPVRRERKEVPHIHVAAALIWRKGRILIARRPSRGLLGGLWEFPGGKQKAGETLPQALAREIREELGVGIKLGEEFGIYRHGYTHFRVTLHAFTCQLKGASPPRPIEASELAWVKPSELGGYPMGRIDRRISNDIRQLKIEFA